MARYTIVKDDCKRKISPHCTGTFTYERKKGRPPVACMPCRSFKPVRVATTPKKVVVVPDRPTEGTCGCGNKFGVQATGRIPIRCEECRASGTVWRTDSDGVLQMIRAEQVAREEQERKDAAGHERAKNLVERMKPLLEKKNRTVITH